MRIRIQAATDTPKVEQGLGKVDSSSGEQLDWMGDVAAVMS